MVRWTKLSSMYDFGLQDSVGSLIAPVLHQLDDLNVVAARGLVLVWLPP